MLMTSELIRMMEKRMIIIIMDGPQWSMLIGKSEEMIYRSRRRR
jgi:hypothetical protein